ncbi:HOIL1 protein, partial [Struthidea cinerea]|nr:HOIL1 protein [Struthidea cinerea]
PLAEFDLRDISYRVRGPTSHELELPPAGAAGSGPSGPSGPSGSPGSPGTVSLRFPEEREAQQWWTVLSSSLREARRGGTGLGTRLGT